jgi:hypothetical protein
MKYYCAGLRLVARRRGHAVIIQLGIGVDGYSDRASTAQMSSGESSTRLHLWVPGILRILLDRAGIITDREG